MTASHRRPEARHGKGAAWDSVAGFDRADDRRSEAGDGEGATAGDHTLAAELASRAGALLVERREQLFRQDAPAAVLRAEGDKRSQELLARELSEARPRDAVLSEEALDDPSRLDSRRVWVLDPLDGTREFSESGRSDWAVHVALAVGERAVAGAVALPALGLTLSTLRPPRLPAARSGPPRLVVSRSRPPAQADAVAAALGAQTVPLGSAGAKAMAVVRGDADIYVHAGGQYEWDSCAPVAVAAAAGCAVSRLDGSALRYNQPDPYLPDLIVCRPELHGAVLSALAGL